MRLLLFLLTMLSSPAWGEPAYYEALDFKNCLHWSIDNEIRNVSVEPVEYKAALDLANRQPFSRHRNLNASELEKLYTNHLYEMAIVFSASAYSSKSKKYIGTYGVCRFTPDGLACMPNQDFPLAGASYKVAPSTRVLKSLYCRLGCDGSPEAIHGMRYENMEGEKNVAREIALQKLRKVCGASSSEK